MWKARQLVFSRVFIFEAPQSSSHCCVNQYVRMQNNIAYQLSLVPVYCLSESAKQPNVLTWMDQVKEGLPASYNNRRFRRRFFLTKRWTVGSSYLSLVRLVIPLLLTSSRSHASDRRAGTPNLYGLSKGPDSRPWHLLTLAGHWCANYFV